MEAIAENSVEVRRIAVIVAGIDHYNSLGMVRSIGETGLPIYFINKCASKSYVECSRYITRTFRIEDLAQIDTIVANIGREYDSVVVLPLTDEMAIYFDRRMDSLGDNVIVPGMQGHLDAYMNKSFSKTMASKAGLLTPAGKRIYMKTPDVSGLEYPCILKPEQSSMGRKCDIEIAPDEKKLYQIIRKYEDIGYESALAEKYIEGKTEYMIEIMGERSSKGISFGPILKKVREYPILNGSTAYAEIVESIPEVNMDAVYRYIEDTGYIGLFDIELKYADGNVYFIECNFRNGAPSNALTLYGVNLPALWIGEMLDTELKSKQHKKYSRIMVEQTDVLNMIKGNVSFLPWLKQFIVSKKLFWSFRDFVPCMRYYRTMIGLKISRIRGK